VDEEVLAADVAVAQNVESANANNSEGEGARSPLVKETHISLYRWSLDSCHTSNPVEVPRQTMPATKFEIRLAVSIPKRPVASKRKLIPISPKTMMATTKSAVSRVFIFMKFAPSLTEFK
jgi:hypothetical protein